MTGKEGALNKAKSYLLLSAFSYTGLIEQLEYEGFTYDQASCGASQNGSQNDKFNTMNVNFKTY